MARDIRGYMEKQEFGVVVGRFQIDDLHEGHEFLLSSVYGKHGQNMCVIIGDTGTPATRKNPLTIASRAAMVNQWFNTFLYENKKKHWRTPIFEVSEELDILSLKDNPSDAVWSDNLDKLLNEKFGDKNFILYGGRDSFIKSYRGIHLTIELPDVKIEQSSTNRRELIYTHPAYYVAANSSIRMGMIRAVGDTIPRIYSTVDIAMIKNKEFVLMGKKPGELTWRFPGGFVDIEDETLEAAARREFFEETKLTIEGSVKYLKSFTIDDFRYRNCDDAKIMTSLFIADYCFGIPEASDDLQELEWIPLNNNWSEDYINPVHLPLFKDVVNYVQNN